MLTKQEIEEMDAVTGFKTSSGSTPQQDAINSRVQELKQLAAQGESSQPTSSATFQATGKENIFTGGLKTLGNLPKSTYELGKNVVQAVANPIDTAKAVGGVVAGGAAKIGEKFLEDTDIGQHLLRGAKDRGVEIEEDETGKLKTKATPELEQFNNVVKFFGDRYGSVEKFKKTVIEDPAGALADISTVLTGGGSATTKLGQISKVAPIVKTGEVVSKAGAMVEPVTAITKTLKGAKDIVSESTPGKIISDISPTSYKMQQGQVTKALELTPGDLSTIQKKTGNDVTKFIIDKGLIRQTPEETASALNETRKATMQNVRGEIDNVKTLYTQENVPSLKQGLNVILKGVDEVPGLEDVATQIKTLADKNTLTLSDVQKAKELIDDNSNIYTKIGDTKSAAQSRGLDKIRKDLKSFIEDEVIKNTDGQVDIRDLNNEVQTTYALEEAIANRAVKGLPRQYLSVFDGLLGAGVYSQYGFLPAVGVVVGKQIAQSPVFRLWTAKMLGSQPTSFIKKVTKEFADKKLSPQTIKTLSNIIEEAKSKSQYVESGAAALSNEE